jgi:glycosyltransferase involved in cell wall biosynthesis
VDVITTCARQADSWKNEYPEGPDRVRGVRIRRFPVSQPRTAGVPSLTARLVAESHGRVDELQWAKESGPWSTGLLDHLRQQHHIYDAVVFFSMMSATTVFGLPLATERSVLFPCVELTPTLRFGLWPDTLSSARAIGWISAAERRLVRNYLRTTIAHEELVGIGIERSPQRSYPRHQQDPADDLVDEDGPATDDDDNTPAFEDDGVPFRRRHRLYESFALYGGRVEADNGSQEMLDYFEGYAASTENPLQLVLMGMKMMRVREAPAIRLAGMLPDRERMVAFEATDVTIAPASSDLLAESVLESFAVGTPVLASARNEAAVEHCCKANAGLYYGTREEFVECLQLLTNDHALRETLGENGRKYVDEHYRWDAVVARLERLLGRIRSR